MRGHRAKELQSKGAITRGTGIRKKYLIKTKSVSLLIHKLKFIAQGLKTYTHNNHFLHKKTNQSLLIYPLELKNLIHKHKNRKDKKLKRHNNSNSYFFHFISIMFSFYQLCSFVLQEGR